MNQTVVTALPYFREKGEQIATAVGARFIPYEAGIFTELYHSAEQIIAIMAAGIVIRSLAPLMTDKWRDPAVVVISPDMRYAIPILGGHHGGNDLAYLLQERCNLIPVITTATEATGKDAVEVIAKSENLRIVNTSSTRQANAAILTGTAGVYRVSEPGMVIASPGVSFLVAEGRFSVGIGCRLGTPADEIISAINTAFENAGISKEDVAIFASVALKAHEPGLLDAIRALGANIIFLQPSDLSETETLSKSAASRFGLPGVAEPAALAVSVRHQLIMQKQVFGNVTIAIAE
ncbi:cobalt-precorrin 5A hydrolase [Methanospirillum stamsii]|uniref:Cobalt-precorrin 5A hydrolase n=1 Tax=Methanospirillum stamsii TaxID=1277351 RepID=A0A2V2NIF8_9EURY|nr:cobalt-precorrin 5A hydrolase [Methanospirillum stamsii]PWR75133.1 cobalt-precorrin 5A hydrolase [Methanospirillum stamsii]